MNGNKTVNAVAFILALVLGLLFITASANCQDPDPSDAAAIRKIIAERNAALEREEAAERRAEFWKKQADHWRGVANQETERAEGPQEERIKYLQDELASARRSEGLLEQKDKNNLEEIGRLNRRVSSLKFQRNAFAIGSGVGGAAVGFLACRATSTTPGPTIINNESSRPTFGLTIRF